MQLTVFKTLAASLIFIISLGAGIASLRFMMRYQRSLQLGDALANGIFIGVAIFHLIPNTLNSFNALHLEHSYSLTVLLAATSFALLWILEQVRYLAVWMLFIAISIHATISGLALGVSDSLSMMSIIFIAIIAHKGFEAFALAINLSRKLGTQKTLWLIGLFSLFTPLGITVGSFSESFMSTTLDHYLTACFSAFAAGTFLYIGAIHTHHKFPQKSQDSYHEYSQILAMLVGVILMAILGIWV